MSDDTIPTTESDAAPEATGAPSSATPPRPADGMAGGEEQWARPVAQRRDRNIGAWLAMLSLLCFAVAVRGPANRLFWRLRNRYSGPESGVERTAESFLAISYEAVSAAPDPEGLFTTVPRFREHLEALRDAGYHPIGLEDVRAFYRDGAKLPPKAILVTFENTHKSTYFDASPVLRALRWRAVLGVVTRHVTEKSPDSVLAPYLRDMTLDNVWDLACESDLGTTLVPAGPDGNLVPFLATPRWIAEEERPERPEEFEARVRADHERAAAVFAKELETEPGAFFFPVGNYGQYEERNRAIRRINLDLVGERYGIGFLLGSRALNTAGTDRRRLNRLRVAPEWTAGELLSRLEREWPVGMGRGAEASRIPPDRWSPDWGALDTEGSTVRIRALPPADPLRTDADATGGARAWIAGTDGFHEGSFEARFLPLRGEFHVYLPFSADDEWLRVELSDTGRVTVRRCAPGLDPVVLASGTAGSAREFRQAHSLLLTMRDGLLFVRLDGEPLLGGPVELPSDLRPGLVGAGVWADVPGLAQTDVLESHLRPRSDGLATWAPSLSRDSAHLCRALLRDAFRHTVVSPPWIDVHAGAPVAFPSPDMDSLAIVARTGRARVMPSVAPHDEAALATLEPSDLAAQAVAERADGLFVDAGDFPAEALPRLKDWAVRLAARLEGRKLGMAIRLPEAIRRTAAAAGFLSQLPAATLLVDDEGTAPPGVDPTRVLALLRVAAPAESDDLALFYQLSDYASSQPDEIPESARLRQQGIRAYSEGRYAEAADLWQRWADGSPDEPEAWALLGNARSRMSATDAAIDAYGRSLQLAPGQIELALERARLLERAGRTDESGELLDSYARAFPGDPRIAVSQALWLDRHGRRAAGRDILRDLVERNPADIETRLALQSLLDDPADRYANMHKLLRVGTSGPTGLLGFGHDIERAELLSSPEASIFLDFLRETATNAPQEAVRDLYAGFLPLSEPIVEPFDASRLSENWTAFGTPLAAIAGAYDLRAASDMSEAYLRLRRSELLRDGFIEVTLSESVGAFWLYARRSSRSLVRFGFDGDGFLRIQTWSDGEIRTGDSRAWIRPGGDVTLRLEVRGDGAIGLVDGKPGFATPLPVPPSVAYGWWSVAPFSPELGVARARISRISAGPLSSSIAFLRETEPDRIAAALDRLRGRVRELSAVSPVLFAQRQDGTIPSEPLSDPMPFRMFCSYHRLRLIPSVALDYESHADPEALVRLIRNHRLSGLVLHVRAMPTPEWFEKTTALLETTTADLIVVVANKPLLPSVRDANPAAAAARLASLPPVEIRELERGPLLLHPAQSVWTVPATPFRDWPPFGPAAECAAPQIIVIPSVEEETSPEPAPESAAPESAVPGPVPEEPAAAPESAAPPPAPSPESAAPARAQPAPAPAGAAAPDPDPAD